MVRMVRYHGPYLGYSTNIVREGHAFDYTAAAEQPRKQAKSKKKRKLNNTCQKLFKGK